MKVSEAVDHAHQIMTLLGGMSVEDRLQILKISEIMVKKDWTAIVTASHPFLSVVAGG